MLLPSKVGAGWRYTIPCAGVRCQSVPPWSNAEKLRDEAIFIGRRNKALVLQRIGVGAVGVLPLRSRQRTRATREPFTVGSGRLTRVTQPRLAALGLPVRGQP